MGFMDYMNKTVGGIPLLGSALNGAQSLYHSGAAAYDVATGDQKGAKRHAGEAGWHALKAVPGVGSVMTIAEFLHDDATDTSPGGDPSCVAPYTGTDGQEHCYDSDGNDMSYDQRSLVEKFTDWVIPYGTD
jgi:hypothetical protein